VAGGNENLADLKFSLSEDWQRRIAPWLLTRNFLLVFALVFFLIAWNRGIALIYGLSALMLGVLMVAFLAPYLSLRGVNVTRQRYFESEVDAVLEMPVHVTAGDGRKRYMLQVVDAVPCATDDSRNPMIYLPRLRHAETTSYQVKLEKRGMYELGPLVLQSGYPLGVQTVRRTLEETRATLLVKPSPFRIGTLHLSRAAPSRLTGVQHTVRRGGHDEFTALREYRSGDSLRHVHWSKSSQGRGLFVREYDSHRASAVNIVLNRAASADHGEAPHSTFEYQVRIAVSVARYCTDQGIPVALYGCGPGVDFPDCTQGHYQKIVESLALVNTLQHGSSYLDLLQSTMQRRPQGCWVVFANDDDVGFGTLRYHAGVSQLLPVVFNLGSFGAKSPGRGRAFWNTATAYRISRFDELEKVFQ